MKLLLCLLICCSLARGEELGIFSLNLHGYHPKNEKPRYLKYPNGKSRKTESHLFYFKKEELIRGNKKRVQDLAQDLKALKAKVLLFQEVGAGSPHKHKSCQDFYKIFKYESPWENTVFRLGKKLANYRARVACRGNIGWVTNNETFSKFEIPGVFKKGDNPYPKGVLIEGFGALIHRDVDVLYNGIKELEYNYLGHKLSFQYLKLKFKGKLILLANVHMGHKVNHFEQAVALQYFLGKERSKYSHTPLTIVAGDLNENPDGDAGIPWLLQKSSKLYFLKDKLMALNNNSYKPWATIHGQKELNIRIEDAIFDFESYSENSDHHFYESFANANCFSKKILPTSCSLKYRIDYIFSNYSHFMNKYIVYPKNNWRDLNSNSDHPGIYSSIKVFPNNTEL